MELYRLWPGEAGRDVSRKVYLVRSRFLFCRNVPGVAIYFYSLQALRQRLTQVSAFGVITADKANPSALPKLSPQGNLVSGVVTRLGVGLLLNPFSVMKARFEVSSRSESGIMALDSISCICCAQSDRYAYKSMWEAFTAILRESGPRGLVQGYNASALRDAPFAGLYVLFYEAIKDKTCTSSLSSAFDRKELAGHEETHVRPLAFLQPCCWVHTQR